MCTVLPIPVSRNENVGVTKLDRIRNERIRGTTKVGEISKKVQESRLRWYGHVLRREDEYVGKRVMAMEVPGKRKRGSLKRRWLDNIKNDLLERENCQGRKRKTGMEACHKKRESGKGCGRRLYYLSPLF